MPYPCLALFLCFATGVAAGHYLDLPVRAALGTGAALWTAALPARVRGYRRLGVLLLLLVVTLAGAVRATLVVKARTSRHLTMFAERSGPVRVTGVVRSAPERLDTDGRFRVDAASISVRDTVFRVEGGILARCRGFVPDVRPGDRVDFDARLRAPDPARNPGDFDYASYLARQDVFRTALIRGTEDLDVAARSTGLVDRAVAALRGHVRKTIRANLSGTPSALVEGVLLGDKRGVPASVRDAFSRAGVSHVLAVSGLHVGLVAAGAFFCVRSLGGGGVWCGAATTAMVWIYALVTGLPASVVRAASVASLVVWSKPAYRRIEGLNALGFAGLAILAVRPLSLFDLGFQLSFAATGGILLLHRDLARRMAPPGCARWRRWLAVPIAVSLSAQLATAPLVVAAFGRISLVATGANLVVVPLLSASVGVGLLTVAFGAVSSWAATLLNGANWALLSLAAGGADLFASPDWASVSWGRPPGMLVAAYALALLWCASTVRACRSGRRVLIAALVAANVHVWTDRLGEDAVTVRVLDVGQGDGILVSFPNGRHILIDGGNAGFGSDAGARVVLPALNALGVRRLEAIVATHPHADHIGGLVSVMAGIEVGHYLESGQRYGSSTVGRIGELIEARGIRRHVVAAGDTIAGLGAASVLVLHPRRGFVNPDGEAPEGVNNGSVVLKVTYAGRSILLTGDIEHESDPSLLAWGDRINATILKAAHHGSSTSSSRKLLSGVRPRWVAVSCGVDNRFGHPSPEVLARYTDAGIACYRTDRSGCLTFRLSRDGITADRFLNPEGGR